MPLIVSDAGPLIALSRVGQLSLLHHLFKEVVVPTTVLNELRLDEKRPGVEPLAEAVHSLGWIRSMSLPESRSIPGLGEGEAAAIQLAEHLACPLLIDERRGRIAARNYGLDVIGTGRVLLAAKEKNLIDTVKDILDALNRSGYRLSDELCRRLLELAGEG